MRAILLTGLLVLMGCGKQEERSLPPSDTNIASRPKAIPSSESKVTTAFDPESADNTLQWFIQELEKERKILLPGNMLSETPLSALLKSTAGKAIRWRLPVQATWGDDKSVAIRVQPTTLKKPATVDPRHYTFDVGTFREGRDAHLIGGHLGGEPFQIDPKTAPWVSKISSGQPVVVSGLVGGWFYTEQGYVDHGEPRIHVIVCLRLRDLLVSKP